MKIVAFLMCGLSACVAVVFSMDLYLRIGWVLFYVFTAVYWYLIFKSQARPAGRFTIPLFFTYVLLNLAWPPYLSVFQHNVLGDVAVLSVLAVVVLIGVAIFNYRANKLAAWLLLPCLAFNLYSASSNLGPYLKFSDGKVIVKLGNGCEVSRVSYSEKTQKVFPGITSINPNSRLRSLEKSAPGNCGEEAQEGLGEVLSDPCYLVRLEAVKALTECPGKKSFELLMKFYGELGSDEIAEFAARIRGAILGGKFKEYIPASGQAMDLIFFDASGNPSAVAQGIVNNDIYKIGMERIYGMLASPRQDARYDAAWVLRELWDSVKKEDAAKLRDIYAEIPDSDRPDKLRLAEVLRERISKKFPDIGWPYFPGDEKDMRLTYVDSRSPGRVLFPVGKEDPSKLDSVYMVNAGGAKWIKTKLSGYSTAEPACGKIQLGVLEVVDPKDLKALREVAKRETIVREGSSFTGMPKSDKLGMLADYKISSREEAQIKKSLNLYIKDLFHAKIAGVVPPKGDVVSTGTKHKQWDQKTEYDKYEEDKSLAELTAELKVSILPVRITDGGSPEFIVNAAWYKDGAVIEAIISGVRKVNGAFTVMPIRSIREWLVRDPNLETYIDPDIKAPGELLNVVDVNNDGFGDLIIGFPGLESWNIVVFTFNGKRFSESDIAFGWGC